MVHSAIMAVIRGSLLLISTPTEHNVHNNVCCLSGCTTPTEAGLHRKQTRPLQEVKLHIGLIDLNINIMFAEYIVHVSNNNVSVR